MFSCIASWCNTHARSQRLSDGRWCARRRIGTPSDSAKERFAFILYGNSTVMTVTTEMTERTELDEIDGNAKFPGKVVGK